MVGLLLHLHENFFRLVLNFFFDRAKDLHVLVSRENKFVYNTRFVLTKQALMKQLNLLKRFFSSFPRMHGARLLG